MQSLSRIFIWSLVGLGMVTILIVTFHIGGIFALRIGQFAPLSGAFLGGCLVLASTTRSFSDAQTEEWTGNEHLSWILIGVGIIAWSIGDSIWRYYVSIGQTPFPSLADIGYVTFPLLAFMGLLLQPLPDIKGRRFVLLTDSLISMGSILAIAWYLLLGAQAQAPSENLLGKILGLYYPAIDTALLSYVVFLLLRGQGSTSWARHVSLIIFGLGLCFFVTSDFIFNIQQNANTYVEATWVDLGWPLGMITIGIAACLRRFPPARPQNFRVLRQEQARSTTINPLQLLPYALVGWLFIILAFNVLTNTKDQQAIRPVLVITTLSVVTLILIRQVVTIQENARLFQEQTETLKTVEAQARQIREQNSELERGIAHLKEVLVSLANGNLQARATLTHGVLWPLAAGLNIMVERWTRLGRSLDSTQRLRKAIEEVSRAVELGTPLPISESYYDFPEIDRLITALRHQEGSSVPPAESSTQYDQYTPPSHLRRSTLKSFPVDAKKPE
ncbi:MAG TPA: hypothetical protein VFB12_28660 [Ktedonobacteraceae bacterium]|nr:hypothetical protein [Ktedonobacteraceae bacterium]